MTFANAVSIGLSQNRTPAQTTTVGESIDSLRTNYESHSRAARSIAETWFNSDVVLSSLLERVGTTA